jgi:hypothetical protein
LCREEAAGDLLSYSVGSVRAVIRTRLTFPLRGVLEMLVKTLMLLMVAVVTVSRGLAMRRV